MTGKRKIRVAVVGLVFGRIWVPAYKGHPDVEYVGVCDIDRNRLEAVADQYDIERRHTDLKSILESDEYDAVHLLTPIPLHVEQTLAVLMSGKHCACAIPKTSPITFVRARSCEGSPWFMSLSAASWRNAQLL